MRLILVSIEGKERDAYLNAIRPYGIQVDTVSSFLELRRLLTENVYNGIMIDLKTKIKGQWEDKELAYEILEQFPLVQLKFEEKTGSILTLYYGQSAGGGTLDTFINEDCRSFTPRSIRSSARKKIHFNVIISKSGNFSEDHIFRSVTIDISKGGCFMYSTDNWELNQQMMFTIKELDDNKPILSEVRWIRTWGKAMQIPGIGVKFDNMDKSQLKKICDKGHIS